MGDLSRRESREAFRDLIWEQDIPADTKTRLWQMIQSIVFSQDPFLQGLSFFEIRSGSGAPSSGGYPNNGFGFYIDTAGSKGYIVLKWGGSFFTWESA